MHTVFWGFCTYLRRLGVQCTTPGLAGNFIFYYLIISFIFNNPHDECLHHQTNPPHSLQICIVGFIFPNQGSVGICGWGGSSMLCVSLVVSILVHTQTLTSIFLAFLIHQIPVQFDEVPLNWLVSYNLYRLHRTVKQNRTVQVVATGKLIYWHQKLKCIELIHKWMFPAK